MVANCETDGMRASWEREPATHNRDDLLGFLTPERVVAVPANLTKQEVLTLLVTTLADQGQIPSWLVGKFSAALLKRERLGTTGLGRGIALPHWRSSELEDFAGLIGVAREGIDFEALDGLPTRLVILVLSPFGQRERHLAILGRLATLLSDRTLQYSVQFPRSPQALLQFLGIRFSALSQENHHDE